MNNKTLIIGALVLVAGLIALSKLLGSGGTVSPISPHGGERRLASVEASQTAPDFTLTKLGGGEITLSEYKGKPVILDFFATWCPNCRRDMPKLSRMYDKYKDQVEVIGINLQESENKVQSFVNGLKISFPIALDPRSQAVRLYGVQYTNFHILIGKDGNIAGIVPGDINESQINALIKRG